MHKADADEDCFLVDDRIVRANATLTTTLLGLALIAPRTVSVALLALQAVVFLIGILAPAYSPYTRLSKRLRLARLFKQGIGEHPKPVRFSQQVGLTFILPALVLLTLGSSVGLVLVGFCLVASALNAFAGICIACRLYPRLTLLKHKTRHLFQR